MYTLKEPWQFSFTVVYTVFCMNTVFAATCVAMLHLHRFPIYHINGKEQKLRHLMPVISLKLTQKL